MSEVARHHHIRGLSRWGSLLVGSMAGLLAAVLLLSATLPRTVMALAGLAGGLVVVVMPQIGLYLVAGLSIGFWPGGLAKLVGLALTGGTIFWAAIRQRRLLMADGSLITLLALTGLVACHALASGSDEAVTAATSYLGFVAFYWTVATLADRPAVMHRLVASLLVSGLIIAVIGFVQFRFPFIWFVSTTALFASSSLYRTADVTQLQRWGDVFRIDSLTGTPDYLGLTMQILLPFAVLWTARQPTRLGRAAGVGLTLALLGALVLSFTRAVMFTTAVVVIPLLVARLGWRRALPPLMVGALMVGGAMLGWEPLRERVFSIVTEWLGDDVRSAGGWRRALLPIAWQMLLDHFWTGTGIGQHRLMIQNYAPSELLVPLDELQIPIHNGYLVNGIELGFLGLVLLVVLVIVTWRRLRQVQRHLAATNQAALLSLAHAAEAAWIGMACNIAFYPDLATFRYYWVLLAVAGGLSRIVTDQRTAGQRGGAAR